MKLSAYDRIYCLVDEYDISPADPDCFKNMEQYSYGISWWLDCTQSELISNFMYQIELLSSKNHPVRLTVTDNIFDDLRILNPLYISKQKYDKWKM